jgi:hypothetical protein
MATGNGAPGQLHCARLWGRLTPAAGYPARWRFRWHFETEESAMSNPQQAAQGSAATAKKKLTFKQMSPRQKTVFVLKLTVSILSFGMIFPNLMND